MSASRLVALAALAALGAAALAAPLAAQGIPRGAHLGSSSGAARWRLLVANPYVFGQADSAPAVHAGDGMRKRMDKVAGSDFSVVSDSIMNAALLQFGYWRDAILTPSLARTLAKNLPGTRVVVTSTMSKAPDGNRSIVARLTGTNDDVGNVVKVTQAPGQPIEDLGAKAADAMQSALKSLTDARTCMDQRIQNKDKATDAAGKALKALPTNGLAHYCLALIADSNHAQADMVRELEAAVAGDSLSVIALRQLAQVYETKGDTARAVATLQQILRAAPTDQELRQSAFRYFLSSGNTDAAIQVADEGLRLDPSNWDLYDLKSNACLFAAKYACAVDALGQAYQTDSTRADTLFFAKVVAAAEQRLSDTLPRAMAVDTATYVQWAIRGSRRFPTNITLLQGKNRAFAMSGQVDSSLAVTRQLMALDSTNVVPALAAEQALLSAKRYAEAQPYIDFVVRRGDPDAKTKASGLLVTSAVPLLQPPTPDYKAAADMLRQAIKIAPNATFAPTANYLFGLATFFQVPPLDPLAEKGKSCDIARQMGSLLKESETALNIGKTAKPEDSAKFLGYIEQFKPRVASMLKAYCK